MAHWRTVDGQLVEFVPNKSKGGLRPTTLRDARQLNLYPSVTDMLTILNRPMLNNWRVKVAIEAAISDPLPRINELDTAATVEYFTKKSEEYVNWAADFGTQVHGRLSELWQLVVPEDEQPILYQGTDLVAVDPLLLITDITRIGQLEGVEEVAIETFKWMLSNGYQCTATELSFVSKQLGYGGSADFVGTHYGKPCLLDVKTQDFEVISSSSPNYWEEFPLQIAGYDEGLRTEYPMPAIEDMEYISLVTSRTKPGLVASKMWNKDMDKYRKQWKMISELWFLMRGYDPRVSSTEEQLQGEFLMPQDIYGGN